MKDGDKKWINLGGIKAYDDSQKPSDQEIPTEPEEKPPKKPAEKESTDSELIAGETYLQSNKEGLASYHFKSPLNADGQGGSYISYEAAPKGWKLNWNGPPFPKKKFWEKTSFDLKTRTFKGLIKWAPDHAFGMYYWDYTMVFSQDYERIEGGVC